MDQRPSIVRQCLAEVLGTFILVLFGTGSVFVAVLTGELKGVLQVAIVWGLAIALAIYSVGAISGAHLNPAVTIAVAALRKFPWPKVPLFILSQFIGAILASLVLLGLFSSILRDFESKERIVRGAVGSERSAMVFGEYFPNPGAITPSPEGDARVSHKQAMLAEIVGTALLAFFIFALTDPTNRGRPDGTFAALFIGLTVTILICLIAPLTQAGFNPARDFGPRIVAYFAGWKAIAIPGPRGGFFTVYILSPILGALAGGLLYEKVLRRPSPQPEKI